MDDSLMFDYLVQMGQMRPEEAELKKKQAMVEALRKGSMTSPEGQMIGKHYVAPNMMQNLAQVAQGYAAMKGQEGVDDRLRQMNSKQAGILGNMQLEAERRRRERLGMVPGGSAWGSDLGME